MGRFRNNGSYLFTRHVIEPVSTRAKLLWLYSWSNNGVLIVCHDMLALQSGLRALKTAGRMNLGLPHCRLCLFEATHNPLTGKPHSASCIKFWRREWEKVRERESERKGQDEYSHTGLCCVRCVLIALIISLVEPGVDHVFTTAFWLVLWIVVHYRTPEMVWLDWMWFGC